MTPNAPEPAPVAAASQVVAGDDADSGTAPPVTLVLGAERAHWDRMVGAGEPAFPTEAPTLTFELTGETAILGRVRAGRPADVDLSLTGAADDPAVSHNQCVFERDGDSWTVTDAGSSNGTWINDAEAPLAAGTSHTLADGDRILIGAWTCLTVTIGSRPEEGQQQPGPA